MNFSEITNITIPNGVVNKITTLEGVVLWKKGDSNIPDLPEPLPNEIYYISTDGNIVEPYWLPSNIPLISNTYENGIGKMVFSKDLKEVWYSAFYKCETLYYIKLPNSINKISQIAFSGCSSLISITIPDSVNSIYGSVFVGCKKLNSIVIPSNVNYISEYTFDRNISIQSNSPYFIIDNGFLIEVETNTIVQTLIDKPDYIYNIPDYVRKIGYGAFTNQTYLYSITIPDTVTAISGKAFYYCRNLTNINLSNNLEFISTYTFRGCSSLKNIFIPEGIKQISGNAFRDCTALTLIDLPSTLELVGQIDNEIPLSYTSGSFANCPKLSTIVYRGESNIRILEGTFNDSLVLSGDFYANNPLSTIPLFKVDNHTSIMFETWNLKDLSEYKTKTE